MRYDHPSMEWPRDSWSPTSSSMEWQWDSWSPGLGMYVSPSKGKGKGKSIEYTLGKGKGKSILDGPDFIGEVLDIIQDLPGSSSASSAAAFGEALEFPAGAVLGEELESTDMRYCWSCNEKTYTRKGECVNRACPSRVHGRRGRGKGDSSGGSKGGSSAGSTWT
jgi:hypothetical protein